MSNHNFSLSNGSRYCTLCGQPVNSRFFEYCYVCQKRKWVARDKKKLDVCLKDVKPELVLLQEKKFVEWSRMDSPSLLELRRRRKKVWLNNFQNDFPRMHTYVLFLRRNKLTGLQVDLIKEAIDNIGKHKSRARGMV